MRWKFTYKIKQTRSVKIATVEQKQHDCMKLRGKKRKEKKRYAKSKGNRLDT